MKRTLAILLCAALLLSICGCGIGSLSSGNAVIPTAPPTEPSGTVPAETTLPMQTVPPTEPVPTEPLIPAYQLPLTSISISPVQETDTTESWDTVFTYTYPDITFLHQDAEVARTVLLDLRNRVEAYRKEAQSLKDHAGIITEATGQAPGHSMSVTCEPMRVDQSVLSLLLTCTVESDVNAATSADQFVTYDLVNGRPLMLSHLLSQDATVDQLQTLLLDILSQTEGLYSWYDEILEEQFAGNSLPENWYMSAEGLCFRFAAYELAPYALNVTVPYSRLSGLIRDRYYPPEAPTPEGAVEVIPFEDADLSRFSSFAEVVLSPVDMAFLFYTDGTVSQLRIRQAACDAYPDTFTQGDVIFATDTLCAGQAVRVQTYSESLFYVLHISYVSGGEYVSVYVLPNLIGSEDAAYIIQPNP